MAKFTFEEKSAAVNRSLIGMESDMSIARSMGAHRSAIAKWFKQYQYQLKHQMISG